MSVPKGSVIRRLHSDGTLKTEVSNLTFRVMYLAPAADESLSTLVGSSALYSVLAASANNSDKHLKMLFAGQAAGADANILFDSGASENFVSETYARQTGISVLSSSRSVRLGSDQVVEAKGEANVYLRLGSYHQAVRCVVMPLLHGVDVILGQQFMTSHKCILDFERMSVLMKKGRRRVTVLKSAHRARVSEHAESKPLSSLSAMQVKRAIRKKQRVFLAVIKPLDVADADSDVTPRPSTSARPTSSFSVCKNLDDPAQKEVWTSDLVHEFADVFKDPLPIGLPPERQEGHSIPTEPGHPPPFRPMYRLSPLEYKELQTQVSVFLEAGILEPSKSPYGAPVLFVPKPNGRGLRLCVDYRALNNITVKNRYPIPRIDDLLDAVSGSKYFTSLDLTSGYHQVLISEEDRPKTAFRTPWGHYQFKVLIEGLTNAPATFQSVMNSIFHPFLRRFVVVYLDDILIYSKTAEEHQLHVRQVLEVLRREKFFVCQAKSSFANPETKFLGHIVSADGIRPDPKKVACVQEWPVLKSVHDVRSFLGLVNYFRKFIKDFATLAAPLTDLTRAKHQWEWTDKCQQAFLALKHCLTQAPLLISPDVNKPYEVVTDASTVGLGAVLLQDNRPVAFESRKLSDAEKNYHTTEQEMLAVIHALKTWRCYLEGATFTVVTDHVSNTFFQTQPSLSRRQTRWSEFLQRFRPFDWSYRAGRNNVADPLSRYPVDILSALYVGSRGSNRPNDSSADLAASQSGIPTSLTEVVNREGATPLGDKVGRPVPAVSHAYIDSALTCELSTPLRDSILRESQSLRDSVLGDVTSTENRHLRVNSHGFVVRESRIVIPENPDLRRLLIMEFHDTPYSGHFGQTKTYEAVAKFFWWPSLKADVLHHVSTCDLCMRNKARRHKPYGLLQPLEPPEQPFDSVSYDFITKLPLTPKGHDSICVFVDRLTKMAYFAACNETITAKGFAKLYVDTVQVHQGLSKTFVSDRDTRFTSAFWREVAELLGTRLCMSSAFHASTDGQTEVVNQTLETYLRHFISPQMTDWDDWLSRAQFAYNNSYHASTKDTPFHLVLGRHPRTPLGVPVQDKRPASYAFVEQMKAITDRARKCLVAARQRQKAFADSRRSEKSFSEGEWVLLSTKNMTLKHAEKSRKLLPRWVGPFKIVHKVGSLAYELEMNPGWRIHPVFHISLLEPYRSDGRTQPPPPPLNLEGHLEYEVESILDHRFTNNKREHVSYLLKWLGYGQEHNSWEPETNVANCPELIGEYWQRIARAAGIGAVAGLQDSRVRRIR